MLTAGAWALPCSHKRSGGTPGRSPHYHRYHSSKAVWENGGSDDGDPIRDNLATNGDLIDFMWLEPAESNVKVKKVQHFMAWFKAGTMGSPEVWIGNKERQVKTSAVRAFKKALIYRRFRVVYLPLSHHKCTVSEW